jgi:ubiquinone biosynthesis accessory factor UbiK
VIQPKHLEELSRRVLENLPKGLATVHEDMRDNLRAGLSNALTQMDLVTREEFDVQAGVLRRTRERLEALEAQVAELERRFAD